MLSHEISFLDFMILHLLYNEFFKKKIFDCTIYVYTEIKCNTVHMSYVWDFMRFSTQFSFSFWIKFNFLQKFSESNRWFPGDTSKYLCGDIMWRGLLTQFYNKKINTICIHGKHREHLTKTTICKVLIRDLWKLCNF